MIEEAIVEEDEEEAAAEAEALRLQAEATAASAASAGEVSPSLLRRSKSTPLALDDDRSVMTFQLEGAAAASTAETSLASGMDAVGVLVDFSEDPTPSFEPMNLEDRLKQVTCMAVMLINADHVLNLDCPALVFVTFMCDTDMRSSY